LENHGKSLIPQELGAGLTADSPAADVSEAPALQKKNCFSHLLGMIDEFGWKFIPQKKLEKKGKMTHRWVWAKIYDPGNSQNWVTLVASAGQFDTRGLIWRLGI
jgi:hypothetical protein